MSILNEDELVAIRQRRFSIDCLRMTLKRPEGPDKFLGGGLIRQNDDGELECVIYDTMSSVDWKDIYPSVSAGEWLGKEHFWTLTAREVSGREWTAEWVDIDTSSHGDHAGVIIKGTFNEITHRSELIYSKAGFRAYAPSTSRIPTNAITETSKTIAGREFKGFSRDLWMIESNAAGKIIVTEPDEGIDVNVSCLSPKLPDGFAARLEEGFTLVLSTPIYWIVEQAVSDNELTVTIRNQLQRRLGKPRLPPPLHTRQPAGFEHCGVLFDRYVSWAMAHPPAEGRFTSLALMFTRVLRASTGVLEDEAIALSTQVERLVREHFADRGKSSSSFLDAVAKVLEHLATWVGPAEYRHRFERAISQMQGMNPRTALRQLVEEGLIAKRHIDAWEAIRHTEVHGLQTSRSPREQLAMNDLVHQLFLLLVFRIIGYAGPLTDYTTKGYPVVESATKLVKPNGH